MNTIKVRWRCVLRVDTVIGYQLTEAKLETPHVLGTSHGARHSTALRECL